MMKNNVTIITVVCSRNPYVPNYVLFYSCGRFPLKNEELLKQWILALKRKNFKPSKSSRICSRHFKPTDYDPPVVSGPPHLKKDAVPSDFDFPDHLQPKKKDWRILQRITNSTEVCFFFIAQISL